MQRTLGGPDYSPVSKASPQAEFNAIIRALRLLDGIVWCDGWTGRTRPTDRMVHEAMDLLQQVLGAKETEGATLDAELAFWRD